MGTVASPISIVTQETIHDQRWNVIVALVLDGISSVHTRRSYEQALAEFLIWFDSQNAAFTKATLQKYRAELSAKGLAASSLNVRLAALRRLSAEAADNGLLAPEIAAGIERIKGAKRKGIRVGRWLTREQTFDLLSAPDVHTLKGKRDRAYSLC